MRCPFCCIYDIEVRVDKKGRPYIACACGVKIFPRGISQIANFLGLLKIMDEKIAIGTVAEAGERLRRSWADAGGLQRGTVEQTRNQVELLVGSGNNGS